MLKTLAAIGIGIGEWETNCRLRGLENVLTVVQPLTADAISGDSDTPIQPGTLLRFQSYGPLASDGMWSVRVQSFAGIEYEVSRSVLEGRVAPEWSAVFQIRSGNRSLLPGYPSAPLHGNGGPPTLTDCDPQPAQVRTLLRAFHVRLMDGTLTTIARGTTVDIFESPRVEGFCVLRTRDDRIAPIWYSQLEQFSQLRYDDTVLEKDQSKPSNFASMHRKDQRLYVAYRKVYGMGHQGHLFPVEQGAKVLLTGECNDVGYFLDTCGNIFVLVSEQIEECLLAMPGPMSGPVAGLQVKRGGWTAHRHHSDRVTTDTTTMRSVVGDTLNSAQIARLPRNHEGFPLPHSDFKPPEKPTDKFAAQFGYYGFASESDKDAASVHGFADAANVIWAAHGGEERLSDVNLVWTPGTLEGTQAPFGACNAYVMIAMINYMRLWHFGKGPVPQDELPIFTGLDELWHEREGADVSALDGLKHSNPPIRPLRSETDIERQMYDRQGYLGRIKRPVTPSQHFVGGAVPRAAALQREILRASDRSWQFGQPLERPPIDDTAPRNATTSPHPYFVQTEYQVAMPDVLYLYYKGIDHKTSTELLKEVFAPGSKCIAALQKGLPLLTAYGEARSTIVKTGDKKKPAVEVLLKDIPYVPNRIASNEWAPVLGAIHMLGLGALDWTEIVGRMPYTTRADVEWCKKWWPDTALRYRIFSNDSGDKRNGKQKKAAVVDQPILIQHRDANTLRGIVPGLIDPLKPRGQPAQDVTDRWWANNWIPFPINDTNDIHPKKRLAEFDSSDDGRKMRLERARFNKYMEQTEAHENARTEAAQETATRHAGWEANEGGEEEEEYDADSY